MLLKVVMMSWRLVAVLLAWRWVVALLHTSEPRFASTDAHKDSTKNRRTNKGNNKSSDTFMIFKCRFWCIKSRRHSKGTMKKLMIVNKDTRPFFSFKRGELVPGPIAVGLCGGCGDGGGKGTALSSEF